MRTFNNSVLEAKASIYSAIKQNLLFVKFSVFVNVVIFKHMSITSSVSHKENACNRDH